MLPWPVSNMYWAIIEPWKRLPLEAMVPWVSVTAFETTSVGSMGVTGMPFAKAVICASIAAELPGQSGAPFELAVGQQ